MEYTNIRSQTMKKTTQSSIQATSSDLKLNWIPPELQAVIT
jgi:hypothetical protein